MSVKLLKTIRILCFIPFILLLLMSLYNSWNGLDAFINSKYYGYIAFAYTIQAYGITYYWIGIICFCIIILTTIMLNKKRKE